MSQQDLVTSKVGILISRSQTPVWERHFTKLRFALILESLYLEQIVKQSFRKMHYEAGAS